MANKKTKKSPGKPKVEPRKKIEDGVIQPVYADYINVAFQEDADLVMLTFGFTDPHSTQVADKKLTINVQSKVLINKKMARNLSGLLSDIKE